jgi:N-methylhydantoinase B/oxoprolinase/acetone carboxylase alpha subunit
MTSARRSPRDPFTIEVIRNYLLSTVREMHQTTVRTAYSTCFSEGEDFTCALFDEGGRMVVQAYGLPAHSGALVDAMQTIRNAYDSFAPGDVVLHNDPYHGGSHQADVVVCRPVFVGRTMLGFAINRGHWIDIGGMAPGGWCGTARHVIQEALIIPPVKLYDAGTLRPEIQALILRNVRMPRQVWGDVQAQIASNIVAERRVRTLVDKYGLESVRRGCQEAIDYSRRRFSAALAKLPDGEFHGFEIQESDGHGGGPYRIEVTVRKKGTRVIVDFAGTAPQVRGPINCSFTETKAASYTAVMAVVDPFVPMNSGVIELIDVNAPEACLVRPVYPAPVFCSTADPCDKVCEAVLKALASMAPDRVTAGTYCTGNNVTGSGEHPGSQEEFLWYIFESGGCGARSNKDGNNVEWHLMANCKNESMEIWEARYPVTFEGYQMVTDSGGPGRFRGGLGAVRRLRLEADTFVTGCADRHEVAPWGLGGGHTGMPNRFTVTRNGVERSLSALFGVLSPSKFTNVPLKRGDVFSTWQGGGGGYGDPLDRDDERVRVDVLDGYVSREAAERDYGVVLDQRGNVDAEATATVRRSRRSP